MHYPLHQAIPPTELLGILRCPACNAGVLRCDAGVECATCHTMYPACRGYLDFLPEVAPVPPWTWPWFAKTYPWWRLVYLRLLNNPRFDRESECTLMKYLLALQPDGLLLDLACGPAFHTVQLARMFPTGSVFGLDLSRAMLDQGVASLGHMPGARPYLLRGDAFDLPFQDGVLQGVTHQGTLHLHAHPEGIFREVLRVLAPGGVYIGSIEIASRRWLPRLLQHLLKGAGLAFWEEASFRGVLEQIGFRQYERILGGDLLLFRVVKP